MLITKLGNFEPQGLRTKFELDLMELQMTGLAKVHHVLTPQTRYLSQTIQPKQLPASQPSSPSSWCRSPIFYSAFTLYILTISSSFSSVHLESRVFNILMRFLCGHMRLWSGLSWRIFVGGMPPPSASRSPEPGLRPPVAPPPPLLDPDFSRAEVRALAATQILYFTV